MSMSNELLSIISNITCNNNVHVHVHILHVCKKNAYYVLYVTAYIVIIILKCKYNVHVHVHVPWRERGSVHMPYMYISIFRQTATPSMLSRQSVVTSTP